MRKLERALDIWIDASFRNMREKYRSMATYWIHNDYDMVIKQAEDIKKLMESFIDYLKRQKHVGRL